jgi:hypothetical protein
VSWLKGIGYGIGRTGHGYGGGWYSYITVPVALLGRTLHKALEADGDWVMVDLDGYAPVPQRAEPVDHTTEEWQQGLNKSLAGCQAWERSLAPDHASPRQLLRWSWIYSRDGVVFHKGVDTPEVLTLPATPTERRWELSIASDHFPKTGGVVKRGALVKVVNRRTGEIHLSTPFISKSF